MNELEFNFNEIINMIETRRNNAYRKVNEDTLKLIDKKLLENKLKEISDIVEENNKIEE